MYILPFSYGPGITIEFSIFTLLKAVYLFPVKTYQFCENQETGPRAMGI